MPEIDIQEVFCTLQRSSIAWEGAVTENTSGFWNGIK